MLTLDTDQDIHKGKSKVAQIDKQTKTMYVGFYINKNQNTIENFEVFCWNILLSANLLYL